MTNQKINVASPSQRVIDIAVSEANRFKILLEQCQKELAELKEKLASDDQLPSGDTPLPPGDDQLLASDTPSPSDDLQGLANANRLARIVAELTKIAEEVVEKDELYHLRSIVAGTYCVSCQAIGSKRKKVEHYSHCIVTRARCALEALKGFKP